MTFRPSTTCSGQAWWTAREQPDAGGLRPVSVPRCYLATGGTAGLMNLLYNADYAEAHLTPEFYEKTFKSLGFFVAREEECRTMGVPSCRIVAERL